MPEHDPFRDLLVADLALTLDLTRAREVADALEGYWAAREQVETDLAAELHRVAGFSLESLEVLLSEADELIRAAGGSREAVLSRGGIAATFHTSVSQGLPDAPARPQPELRPWPEGRYENFRPIGVGGMGMVFLVFDRELDREVALKVVHPGGTTDSADSPLALTPPSETDPGAHEYERRSARFLQEARVTSGLEHPGILPIYSVGETPRGVPYYTMRYVRGERTLAEAIRSADGLTERLPLLDAFLRICDTIDYAHSRGVIHRDLKPANIAIGEFGEVVVLDWGLARVVEDEPPGASESSGRALGTPGYLSPEAARGDTGAMDEQSDVYSLGATLYEILTRRRPFEFRDLAELRQRLDGEDPPPASEREPATPPELAHICARALSRRPEDRFAGAGALADAVRDYLRTSETEGRVTAFVEEAAAGLEESKALSGSALFAGLDRVTSLALQARELRPEDPRAAKVLAECDTRRERAIRQREKRARRSVFRRATIVALLLGAVTVGLVTALVPADPSSLSAAEEAELREQLATGDRLCEEGRALLEDKRHAEAVPVIEEAVRASRELHEKYGDRVDTARLLSRSLRLLGRQRASVGDWNATVVRMREAVDTLKRVGAADLPRTAAGTALALAMLDLGDYVSQLGRLSEGEGLLRDALPLLAGRDRIKGLVRLGRCLWQQQRFDDASEFIDEAEEAAARGVADSTDDPDAAHDFADVLNWKAGLEYVRGNIGGALESYRQCAENLRSLQEEGTRRLSFSETRDIALRGIALCRHRQGKWELALRAHEERVKAWRDVREQNPESRSAVAGLASGLSDAGYIHVRRGRAKAALVLYGEAIPLQRGLVESCPEHCGWRLSWVELLIRSATAGRSAGERAFVDGLLVEADEPIRTLLEREEATTSELDSLALHLKHRSEFHLLTRDHKVALANSQHAYDIRRRLQDRHPNDPGSRAKLAESLVDLGGAYRAAGEPGTALMELGKARRIIDPLVISNPDRIVWRYTAVDCYRRLSDTHRDLSNWPACGVAAQTALLHLDALLVLEPEDAYKLGLKAHLHGILGQALSRRGLLEDALPELEKSVRIRRRQLEMEPASALVHWYMAYHFVLLGNHLVRMGRDTEAVEPFRLAMEAHREACRLEPSWEPGHADYVRRWRRNALFAGGLPPETCEDHMYLGEIRLERERWRESAASFELAMEDPAIRGRLGRPAVLLYAAGAATMAAGESASTEEAAALRKQALEWVEKYVDLLHDEIERLKALSPASSDADVDRLRQLDRWRDQIVYVRDQDTFLAGIRGSPRFAKIFEERK